jgi:RNA polymerase sigma factor (sigma-70 family)
MPAGQLHRVLRHIRDLTGADGPSDLQLLERFARWREEAAFEELVRRHGPGVLAACQRMLGADDAEDAFQATFLVLARKASTVAWQESVGGWLHAVACRIARKAIAERSRRRLRERAFVASAEEDAGSAVAVRELRSVIDGELVRLPAHYRRPVTLCYLEGKTVEQAARALLCPPGTIKSRLARARDILRSRLCRRGLTLSAAGLAAAFSQQLSPAAVPPELTAATVQAWGTGVVSQRVASLIEGGVESMGKFWLKGIVGVVLVVGMLAGGLALRGSGVSPGQKEADAKTLPPLVRSKQSGAWSAPGTWEGGKPPATGNRVQVRAGHAVVYDLKSDAVVRSIHVAGTLSFARDRDTRLDVGLIKIQPGEDASEEGFDCEAHMGKPDMSKPKPALEVGSAERPIPAGRTALIRLTAVVGLDKQSCPAIVCCGGRMDFHGAVMGRSWVKLGATAKKGDKTVTLAEAVTGWKVGDRIIVTMTGRAPSSGYPHPGPNPKGTTTEERTITGIEGTKLTLSAALEHEHLGSGLYRGEVANLSRNVIVESADPKGERGHTMYHKHSAGAISYAEFRHLGKAGVLGRYSLHYHLCGDTMRGSFVIGASIHDSDNRWLAIHGTNYLVVRDNVGYRSKGHGYFLEDGTEVYNVLDRNLAVGARPAKPLPKQALPFDPNDGAGFWWANSLNTFTRNVAVENGLYGYRYEAMASKSFPLVLPIQQADGSRKKVDIRTLPFVRFDDNEGHSQTGLYSARLGTTSDKDGVGPDTRHPFIIRNLLVWNEHYAFNTRMPSVLMEGLRMHGTVYGYVALNAENHVYRNITLSGHSNLGFAVVSAGPKPSTEPFHRIIHDGGGFTGGKLRVTVDGLTFEKIFGYGDNNAMINVLDIRAIEGVAHFRNVKHDDRVQGSTRELLTVTPVLEKPPKAPLDVMPVYLHDHYGQGRHAKAVFVHSKHHANDGLKYREEKLLSGKHYGMATVFAEVADVKFPKLLDPVDDLPPTTVITHVSKLADGKLRVRGTTADNGTVKKVVVNGHPARQVAANFAEWEVVLTDTGRGEVQLKAHAEDEAGNVEKRPHAVTVQP